ncbi:hypothetical protein BJX64DRAFT_228031 [Aspergillus heterothallicus]
MPLSQNSIVHFAATAAGTVSIGFGINAFFRPEHALSFFELDYPTTAAQQSVINNLMYVYGVRDIFMGLACYIAGLYGNSRTLGWTMLAVASVAWADGIICWANGHGQWNHWSHAPQETILGAILLGLFDRN